MSKEQGVVRPWDTIAGADELYRAGYDTNLNTGQVTKREDKK